MTAAVFVMNTINTLPQSQLGMYMAGKIFMLAAVKKIRSAIESKWLPKAVTEFVFRAIVPSIISVNPQSRYVQ